MAETEEINEDTKRKPTYCFNLTDLRNKSFDEMVDRLKQHTDVMLKIVEDHRDRFDYQDAEFVIGKTYARKKKRSQFDLMNSNTWKLDGGVNGRWKEYKDKGFYGLIVLCAVTRDMVPRKNDDEDDDRPLMNQQSLALALEQQLIQYYAYQKLDSRLDNQSLHPGNLERKNAKAGIVYLAYKFEKAEE